MFEASHIIKLTVVLYKVSDFFPVKEPLKFLIRKKADEILAGLILLDPVAEFQMNSSSASSNKVFEIHNRVNQVMCDIEALKAYFQGAKIQGWVKKVNFAVLEKEYQEIEENLKPLLIGQEKKPAAPKDSEFQPDKLRQSGNGLDLGKKRCGKIIEILKQRKTVQVKDLKDVFPTISKRTLRRDFEYLLGKGVVERVGDNNNTLYQLIKR